MLVRISKTTMTKVIDNFIKIPIELHQDITALLNEAIHIENADKGNIQVFDDKRQVLHIIAQKGFADEFLEHFKEAKPFDSSSCGRAIGIGNTIVVSDVSVDVTFIPDMKIIKASGFRAVKSVPIFDIDNNKMGVISTHYINTRWIWDLNSINGLLLKLVPILKKD